MTSTDGIADEVLCDLWSHFFADRECPWRIMVCMAFSAVYIAFTHDKDWVRIRPRKTRRKQRKHRRAHGKRATARTPMALLAVPAKVCNGPRADDGWSDEGDVEDSTCSDSDSNTSSENSSSSSFNMERGKVVYPIQLSVRARVCLFITVYLNLCVSSFL